MNTGNTTRVTDTRPTDVVLIEDDELPAAQDWAYAETPESDSWIFVKRSKMPAALDDALTALEAHGYNVTLSGVQRTSTGLA